MFLSAKNLMRITKCLVVGVTIFCVSWLASVGEWHSSGQWPSNGQRRPGLPTMRTIVAYSEGKQAEMERPYPIACERLPAIPTIHKINRTWTAHSKLDETQWQPVPGTEVTLYNAYYDERLPQHYIRILAMFPGRVFPADKQLYCQTRQHNQELFDSESAVEVVAAKPLEIWYPQWDPKTEFVKTALLLSCPLTEPLKEATIVSIVTEPCEDPSNAFVIDMHEQRAPKRNFTLCVKDVHFEKDISARLIEWIEANKIIEVDKIDMYIDHVHRNTEKILEHYRDRGFLRLFRVPIHKFPDNGLWQRRRNHIVTFNDCLYRNLKESEYIIPLDVDEIIIPKNVEHLSQLVERLKVIGWNVKESTAAIMRNVFFFDSIQKYDEYKCRTDIISEIYVKRDDVRIASINGLENSVKDLNKINDDDLEDNKYKVRCGVNIKEPILTSHTTRSHLISPKGSYSKSILVTNNVQTVFNHYPLSAINPYRTYWFAPFREVQVNHYKESCNATLVGECWKYQQKTTRDCSALRLRRQLKRALALSPCTADTN